MVFFKKNNAGYDAHKAYRKQVDAYKALYGGAVGGKMGNDLHDKFLNVKKVLEEADIPQEVIVAAEPFDEVNPAGEIPLPEPRVAAWGEPPEWGQAGIRPVGVRLEPRNPPHWEDVNIDFDAEMKPWPAKKHKKTETLAKISRIDKRFKEPHLITGGACFAALEHKREYGDIDVYMHQEEIPRGFVFIKDKTAENYQLLEDENGKCPDFIRTVKQYFDTVEQVFLDIIVISEVNNLSEVPETFDIDIAKYFYNPETGLIDGKFVRYPDEIAIVRVTNPKKIVKHVERALKYSERAKNMPISLRINDFDELFI